jgi:protein TonB
MLWPAARRVQRIEPPNSFLGRDTVFHAEQVKPDWIYARDTTLTTMPVAPLAGPQAKSARPSRKRIATIAASTVLHVAVAAWFLSGPLKDAVLVEGAQEQAIVQLGDGDVDAAMSGAAADIDSTSVTIIPITAPKPVEVSEAELVETVEAIEPVTEVAVQPVEENAILPETAEKVTPAPVEAVQPSPSNELPQILATDLPEVIEEIETVQPVEEVAAKEPEPVVLEKPSQPDIDAKREEARKVAAQRERQAEERKKQAAAEQKKKADDARAKRAAQAAERNARQSKAAGQNGASSANARKGRVDGSDKVTSSASKGTGKARAAGNAAVSNYPGKVRSRIARAAGKIPRSLRSKAKGDVVVSFTVTASGGLGGVSVARSSGLPALDSAAVAAVRRAAPFPAIPDGRSSWRFTIPMGLGR